GEAARLAAPAELAENQHALCIQLAELLGLVAPISDDAKGFAHRVDQSAQAPHGGRCQTVSYDVLDVLARPIRRAVVASADARVDRAHEVQVPRHDYRGSSARRSAAARASSMSV